jgi:hypothetical protein
MRKYMWWIIGAAALYAIYYYNPGNIMQRTATA